MFPGTAAAKVKADDHDALLGGGDAASLSGVHRVGALLAVGPGAFIAEGVLTEPIEGDAAQEARGDDAVGVDVVAGNSEGKAFDLGDFSEGHGREGGAKRKAGEGLGGSADDADGHGESRSQGS